MASFPTLKTGAVTQYPSSRERDFSTQIFRFLDGSEQRFPGYGLPLRRWTIQLSLLDESELVNLEQFFESQGGRAGSFSFVDPFDGTTYPTCSFDSDTLALEYSTFSGGKTSVTVKENRG
ncbi:MAG: DUF2460 domain-containing protein [Bryobacteraceae bacterium]